MRLNKKTYRSILVAYFAAMSTAYGGNSRIHLNYETLRGSIPLKTWKDFRDDKVEKQNEDYSCGASSVATILRSFYGLDVTERDILDEVETTGNDGAASFSDLEKAVRKYGFKGVGVSLNYEKLKTLKMPAIVYLHYRDDDHFSVIRGVSQDDIIWLGDSSWGNRKFTEYQFRKMWETRGNKALRGKILLIIPEDTDAAQLERKFFGPRQSIKLLLNY